jgi:DNA-binding transcriptional ArsR family regulator
MSTDQIRRAGSLGRLARDPERFARARAQMPPPPVQAALDELTRALCDPSRRAIVQALRAGPLSVDDLGRLLGRPRPGTSQHLRILRELGIVEVERVGRARYYRLATASFARRVDRALGALEALAA